MASFSGMLLGALCFLSRWDADEKKLRCRGNDVLRCLPASPCHGTCPTSTLRGFIIIKPLSQTNLRFLLESGSVEPQVTSPLRGAYMLLWQSPFHRWEPIYSEAEGFGQGEVDGLWWSWMRSLSASPRSLQATLLPHVPSDSYDQR